MTAEATTPNIGIEYERSRENQAWARWVARSIDALLLSPIVLIAFMAWGVAVELGRLPANSLDWLNNPIGASAGELVAMFLALALWEPLFLSNTGTTPGKFVMGIRVRRNAGERLSWWRALQRFVQVWFVGMGAGIPILTLILMVVSRGKLTTDGVTAWDQNLDCKVEHRKRHPALWTLAIVLTIGTTLALRILGQISESGSFD